MDNGGVQSDIDQTHLGSPKTRGNVKHLTCWFWLNTGYCKWGTSCLYSHVDTGHYAHMPQMRQNGKTVAGRNALSHNPTFRSWQGHEPHDRDARYNGDSLQHRRSMSPDRISSVTPGRRHERPDYPPNSHCTNSKGGSESVPSHQHNPTTPTESGLTLHGVANGLRATPIKAESTHEEDIEPGEYTDTPDNSTNGQRHASTLAISNPISNSLAGAPSYVAPTLSTIKNGVANDLPSAIVAANRDPYSHHSNEPTQAPLNIRQLLPTASAILSNGNYSAAPAQTEPSQQQAPPTPVPQLSETLLRLQTPSTAISIHQSPVNIAAPGPAEINDTTIIPISMREYNTLHNTLSDLRAQLLSASARSSGSPNVAALTTRTEELQSQVNHLNTMRSIHAELLLRARRMLHASNALLLNEGRMAMDLAQALQRGEQPAMEQVTDAYLNAMHLLNQGERLQAETHTWDGALPQELLYYLGS